MQINPQTITDTPAWSGAVLVVAVALRVSANFWVGIWSKWLAHRRRLATKTQHQKTNSKRQQAQSPQATSPPPKGHGSRRGLARAVLLVVLAFDVLLGLGSALVLWAVIYSPPPVTPTHVGLAALATALLVIINLPKEWDR